MGLDDRDYMKDSSGDDVLNLNEIFFLLVKLVVVFALLVVSLRFPILWIKFPLAIVVLVFGWRWIFLAKKKTAKVSSSRPRKKTVARVGSAKGSGPGNAKSSDDEVVKSLIALDAAGEFGKAKTMIQQLDGEEFSEEVGKELAVVAGNYFPIELEPTGTGVLFKLA